MAANSGFDHEEDDAMDDTERLRVHDRRGTHRRRWVRFIPDVSFGTIVQSVAIAIGAGTAYGTYTSDKATDRMRMTAIETTQTTQSNSVQKSIEELKSDGKETRNTMQDIKESMAKIQTRLEYVPGTPPAARGR